MIILEFAAKNLFYLDFSWIFLHTSKIILGLSEKVVSVKQQNSWFKKKYFLAASLRFFFFQCTLCFLQRQIIVIPCRDLFPKSNWWILLGFQNECPFYDAMFKASLNLHNHNVNRLLALVTLKGSEGGAQRGVIELCRGYFGGREPTVWCYATYGRSSTNRPFCATGDLNAE